MSSRGRGGKFQKPKRGGGKHFSRDLRPLNADGTQDNMWAEQDGSGEEEDSDEDSEEESSDEGASKAAQTADMTREERKEAARARKAAAIAKTKAKAAAPGELPSDEESSSEGSDEDEDGDMPANPNHTAKAAKQALKAPAEDSAPRRVAKKEEEKDNLSRREREAIQAQQAKERYQKLHAEGKTEEARADLARLKLVKERREQESARKKAEAEEREEELKAKREQMEREERARDG